jgi:transcriptional regulator with XRE-family HTH domain
MRIAELVRGVRTDAGLSLRALAGAAGVATSTVHRIERGEIHPTMDILERITQAAGVRLRVEPVADYTASIVGLARAIRDDITAGDTSMSVRRSAELAARFENGDIETRHRMIAAEPPAIGDARWEAFVAALAEWLAVRAGMSTPDWAHHADRYLHEGWWITQMAAMRAWEYAGSPASFQTRGVYLHRDSLRNV